MIIPVFVLHPSLFPARSCRTTALSSECKIDQTDFIRFPSFPAFVCYGVLFYVILMTRFFSSELLILTLCSGLKNSRNVYFEAGQISVPSYLKRYE